jgi:hypothetical protein
MGSTSRASLFILSLALCHACGEPRPPSSDSADAHIAAAVPTEDAGDPLVPPAAIPDGDSAVPTCSTAMGQPAQRRDDIDLGPRFPRANWLFAAEVPSLGPQTGPRPPFEPPALGSSFTVASIDASDQPVRCKLNQFLSGCLGGGSRLTLQGASESVDVHVHFEPKELAFLEPGTAVTLAADVKQGTLALKASDGTLLLWILRSGGSLTGRGARSYEAGSLHIASGEPFCKAIYEMCNHLETVQSIVVSAGDASSVIPPSGQAVLEADGVRYEVINHIALEHGIVVLDQPSCPIFRPNSDAISVRHVPATR